MQTSVLTKIPVIGLTGPARVGKDTAADYIASLDTEREIVSFADPIKKMLFGVLLNKEQLDGEEKDQLDEFYGCSPRHMMQTLGTEWGRKLIHPDIWVKALDRQLRIQGFQSTVTPDVRFQHAVIPDIRFENEADYVRQNGILIHIAGRGGINSDHVSERGIIFRSGDSVISNTGTIDDLHAKIRAVFNISHREGE